MLNAIQQRETANWAQELKGNRAVNEFWGAAVALGMHLTTAAGEGVREAAAATRSTR